MDGRVGDRLSFQDVAFLNFDRNEFPYNVGSVGIFEGDIAFEDYLPHIDRRLDLVRRYRQRVVPVPLDVAQPEWFDDPDFDITKHVSFMDLPPPHDRAALMRLAGEFFARPLNRNRPLWEMALVRGLEGGRSAQLAKVHHCMIDGVSGVELLAALLDVKPVPPKGPRARPKPRPPRIPGRVSRTIDAAFDTALDQIDSIESAALALTDPVSAVRKLGSTVRSLWPVHAHLGLPRGRTPWRTALHTPTRLSWARMSLDDAKMVAKKLNGKVNDAVLAVLAGAIDRYLKTVGQETEGLTVRVAIPVNVRRTEEERTLGNRVSFMLVGLPMGDLSPTERFAAIRNDAAAMKEIDQAASADAVMGVLGRMSPLSQRALGRVARVPNILADLICTNVPGPPVPLYCMGYKMVEHHPWVPLGWRMGLGVAVMSYDGSLDFSFTGDQSVDADLDSLACFLEEAATELLEDAGIVRDRGPVRTIEDFSREPVPASTEAHVAVEGSAGSAVASDAPAEEGRPPRPVPMTQSTNGTGTVEKE